MRKGPTRRAATSRWPRRLRPCWAWPLPCCPSPEGLTPRARVGQCPGSNPAEIPQTTDELGELLSFIYDLTVTQAGQHNAARETDGRLLGGISADV